jgi:hypothetical protein
MGRYAITKIPCHPNLFGFLAFPLFKYVHLLFLLWLAKSTSHTLGGVIIFGVGLETNYTVCSVAIYLCIVFYASSKVLIYFFLSTSDSFLYTSYLSKKLP